jgi:hypothetical protein
VVKTTPQPLNPGKRKKQNKYVYCARYEVTTAVTLNIQVFWNVTVCCWVCVAPDVPSGATHTLQHCVTPQKIVVFTYSSVETLNVAQVYE